MPPEIIQRKKIYCYSGFGQILTILCEKPNIFSIICKVHPGVFSILKKSGENAKRIKKNKK